DKIVWRPIGQNLDVPKDMDAQGPSDNPLRSVGIQNLDVLHALHEFGEMSGIAPEGVDVFAGTINGNGLFNDLDAVVLGNRTSFFACYFLRRKTCLRDIPHSQEEKSQ